MRKEMVRGVTRVTVIEWRGLRCKACDRQYEACMALAMPVMTWALMTLRHAYADERKRSESEKWQKEHE
jgi:hypothetical protein